MSQSNAIFAALFIAFVLFITARGELPTYIGFLTGGPTPAQPQQSSASNTTANVAQYAAMAAMFA